MNRRELLSQLIKKYSFEKSHAIIQLAIEDGEYDNNQVHVESSRDATGSYFFTIDWREA